MNLLQTIKKNAVSFKTFCDRSCKQEPIDTFVYLIVTGLMGTFSLAAKSIALTQFLFVLYFLIYMAFYMYFVRKTGYKKWMLTLRALLLALVFTALGMQVVVFIF